MVRIHPRLPFFQARIARLLAYSRCDSTTANYAAHPFVAREQRPLITRQSRQNQTIIPSGFVQTPCFTDPSSQAHHLTMPIVVIMVLLLAGCSSPTAPSYVPPTIINVPPVTVTPTPNPPPVPNTLLADQRYSVSFYRQFALSALDAGGLIQLRRWQRAPMIYLRTIDDQNRAVSGALLEQTATTIINTTSQWSGGAFGVAGLERGTGTREGQAGWITVKWSTSGVCGLASDVGTEGLSITMNHVRRECTCGPLVIKHELGHAMGYYHTDSDGDVMASTFLGVCDKTLSDREIFHARVAYSQPVGSYDPR